MSHTKNNDNHHFTGNDGRNAFERQLNNSIFAFDQPDIHDYELEQQPTFHNIIYNKRKALQQPTVPTSDIQHNSKRTELTITQRPVNIGALNTRGYNDTRKRFQINDYIRSANMDIMGLCELHFTNSSITKGSEFKKDLEYKYYWAIDDNNKTVDPASGLCLMVKNDIVKYVQKS